MMNATVTHLTRWLRRVLPLLGLLLAAPAAWAYTITTGAVQGGTSFCAGATVRVPYTVDQAFNSGNVFTAQLSDDAGSFAAPVSIGTLGGTVGGTIQAVVPAGTTAGSGYRIRVVGSSPATTGADNGTDLTVTNLGTLTASANTPLCVGDNLLLTASYLPGVSYSWTGPAGFSSALRTPSIANVGTGRSGTYTVTAAANGCSTTASVVVQVNALPVITVPAVGAICSGSSVQLTASGGVSYSWSPTTGLSNPGIATPVASPTTSTIYTVTGTSASGCSNTAQVTVTVRATPSVSVSPTNPTICAGSSVTLAATGAQNYQWSPSAGLSNPNSATPVAFPTQTTTYTVTGTSAGCTSTAQVTVTVEAPPTANAGPPQVICSGQSVQLGTAAVAGYTYSWSPATGLSSTTVAQPTATLTNPNANPRTTTYTVTMVSATGCIGSSQTQVTVNPAPAATTGPALALCPGQPGQLGAAAVAGTTYSWSPTTGLSSATAANPTVTLPNPANVPITQTYTLTATRNGCQATGTVAVTVNPAQNASFAYSSAVICTGGSNPTPTLTGPGSGTFSATPTGLVFVSAATGQINAAASAPGTYTVTFTTSGPCADTRTATLTLTTTPSAAFQYGNQTYCLGGGTAAPTLGSGALAGTFTATPAGLVLDAATGTINLAASAAGTYTVTNTVGGGGSSCSATAGTTVTLTPGASLTASAAQPTLCAGQGTTLSATGATTYSWTGGGQTLSGASVSVMPVQTTTYTVTAITAGGCTATAQVTVTVNPVPVLTAGASVGAVCPGQSATLAATGASSYTWADGSGQPLTGASVTVTPTQTTTYTVTGTNASGCPATAQVTVVVNALPSVALALPNASVCAGSGPVALSGGTPTGGTYAGPGVSNGVFSPGTVGPGTYAITYTVTSAQGCQASATQALTVGTCLATAPAQAAPTLTLYPNPSTGLLTLSWAGAAPAATVRVLNVLGQLVQQAALPAARAQALDLGAQPEGVYLVVLTLPDGTRLTRRVVLSR